MHDQFGIIDFRQYWSAFQLAKSGVNFYLPEAMHGFQSLHFGMNEPVMMWNPPWLLLIMSPFLLSSLEASAILWAILGVLLVFGSILLIVASLKRPFHLTAYEQLLLIVLATLFTPILYSLALGQVGSILLFGVSLLYFGLLRNSPWIVGAGALMLSVKPQLFMTLAAVLLWWLIKERRVAFFVIPTLLLTAAVVGSELLFPGIVRWWIGTLSYQPHDLVSNAWNWVTPTIIGAARAYWNIGSLGTAMVLATMISTALVLWCLIARPRLQWTSAMPLLTAVSIVIAPFCWFFDQTVLLLIHVITIVYLLRIGLLGKVTIPVVVALQGFALYFLLYIAEHQHQFYWHAPTLLIIWGLAFNVYRKTEGALPLFES